MPRRLTNTLLAVLVVGLTATGFGGWVEPLPVAFRLQLFDLHRLLGVALILVLLAWKVAIIRRSLARRGWGRSTFPGVAALVVLVGSLAFGLAWTLGLVSYQSLWGYSPLNVHVQLALVLLPFLLWHLALRWEGAPTSRHLVARRNLLRLSAVSAAALVGWQAQEQAARLAALAAGEPRLPTGSRHAGSFSGNAYPVTIWLFDPVPLLDPAAWRLDITGRTAQPGALSLADLAALFPRRELTAVLDCTGGWWSEQVWSGFSLSDLLAARGAPTDAWTVTVVSVTGHRYSLPLAEARGALLATHVGGEPLSAGHGYPLRLVAPGRRGYQWVKWVGRIEVA